MVSLETQLTVNYHEVEMHVSIIGVEPVIIDNHRLPIIIGDQVTIITFFASWSILHSITHDNVIIHYH